jgi:hypothetical protein
MKKARQYILNINGGWSSIKFALYQVEQPLKRSLAAANHKSAANFLIDWLEKQNGFETVLAVGHRVVHGIQHTAPELVHAPRADFVGGRARHANRGNPDCGLRTVLTPLGWGWALFVWGYALAWFIVDDRVKLFAYRVFDPNAAPLLVRQIETGYRQNARFRKIRPDE